MRTTSHLLVAAASLLLVSCATGAGPKASSSNSKGAHAVLLDASGAEHGRASLTQRADGIQVAVHVRGLQPGEKGLHLHTAGACQAPDFSSAGGH